MAFKRKSYKKKRTFKRKARKYIGRRKRGAYGKADGGHKEKLTSSHDFTVDGGPNGAQFVCNWLSSGPIGGNEAFFSGDAQQFVPPQIVQCMGMYQEFLITSVKIEYRPNLVQIRSDDSVIGSILSGTGMEQNSAYPIALAAYSAALDRKIFDSQIPFKRFYRIASYAKNKQLTWRQTSQIGAGFPTQVQNCQTVFNIATVNVPAGLHLGTFSVTYYVNFRYRTRNA